MTWSRLNASASVVGESELKAFGPVMVGVTPVPGKPVQAGGKHDRGRI